jgi:hypothetical protein
VTFRSASNAAESPNPRPTPDFKSEIANLKSQAARHFDRNMSVSIRTPAERYTVTVDRLNRLVRSGKINSESRRRIVARAMQATKDRQVKTDD